MDWQGPLEVYYAPMTVLHIQTHHQQHPPNHHPDYPTKLPCCKGPPLSLRVNTTEFQDLRPWQSCSTLREASYHSELWPTHPLHHHGQDPTAPLPTHPTAPWPKHLHHHLPGLAVCLDFQDPLSQPKLSISTLLFS